MSFFDQIYQSVFKKEKAGNEIISFEPIKRNDKYRNDYFSWVRSDHPQAFLSKVAHSYQLKLKDQIGDPDVHLLNSSQSNGFAISYNERINQTEFQFFFDWLGERVDAMGYKRANSSSTITRKGETIEALEKHYLKPRQTGKDELFDQQYGNILIEYIKVDDRPSYIKFVANTYSDRSYKEAASFESLADFIFTFG